MNAPLFTAGGIVLAAAVMSTLWFVQRRTRNAGIVDVGWAASIAALAVLYSIFGQSPLPFRVVGGAMGLLWGARLAWHLHRRGHGRPEDGRYRKLREKWGDEFQQKLFFFYQIQAVTVGFFAAPFAVIANAPALSWSVIHVMGIALWLIGWIGESIADAQLRAFKMRHADPAAVCKDGLWRYSRHPNYFFEWLVWCGVALYALPAPGGWAALLCPLAMLFLLLRGTGIPATEQYALSVKGEAYRRYQRETSAFIPWFPKKDSS